MIVLRTEVLNVNISLLLQPSSSLAMRVNPFSGVELKELPHKALVGLLNVGSLLISRRGVGTKRNPLHFQRNRSGSRKRTETMRFIQNHLIKSQMPRSGLVSS